MKSLITVVIAVSCLISACAAPVKMAAYPSSSWIVERDGEWCSDPANYEYIRVLANMPQAGTFEELGVIISAQESNSEFFSVSHERQIAEAQKKACQWDADAIVLLSQDSDSHMSYSAFSGFGTTKEKQNRFVAIRFKK
ncbi:MAG TPA: hypothetical protein PKW75_09975 [candidate division Zixibacteria bacterium]|nr:hypothetical protein [candidate division Zixibacteria bacterium]MDD4917113.1 hypothetical protein [candidate division Zixibacteria bacterium]MDM7972703.1 hypothetical protein [candidate division Zixibacteria bacterium]HOD65382.1 hypothetical protein [candidate division Zixibacteria bacterium]HOZ08603.1 hypothetical protein [candidate division Zixibacteria bacterium]